MDFSIWLENKSSLIEAGCVRWQGILFLGRLSLFVASVVNVARVVGGVLSCDILY